MKYGFKLISTIIILSILFSSCSKNNDETVDLSDLKNKTVACVSDTYEYDVADSLESLGATITEFSSFEDCKYAVENNKSDFIVLDEFDATDFVKSNSKYNIYNSGFYEVDFCAVFNKNSDLCNEFNEAVEHLKANGTIDKIKNAYIQGVDYYSSYKDNHSETIILCVDELCEERYVNENDGKYTGTDIEIAKEACEYLDYNLETISCEFDEAFVSLENGNADFIMSAITSTQERIENYDLSLPYFSIKYCIVGK